MDLLSPIKDHHSERRLFIARIFLSSFIAFLLLGTVIARLVQLQVIDHEYFAERSQGNRVRIEPVPPIRGLILDRKGRVLAEVARQGRRIDGGVVHLVVALGRRGQKERILEGRIPQHLFEQLLEPGVLDAADQALQLDTAPGGQAQRSSEQRDQ